MSQLEVFRRMHNDHAQVLDGIAALERLIVAPDEMTRSVVPVHEAVALLARQFGTHMRAEEEALFPALIEALPEARSLVAPLTIEHETLRWMLAGLARTLAKPRTPDRDERLSVEIRDIVDLLRVHIRKEEAMVFGVAERVLRARDLERIGRSFECESPTERKECER
ncbi:MAG: hemerythrin domain-containing protein [Candidatus Eisenbacteria bacterium]|uniref:Hemerythrin domain-containing protein n=1 Tax=Eiseniibacteriota bacterium TaxID=2212470 RepID=A0A9D6QIZ8_UNCEI|nr:hemerythrin domain-containing protein [Candidatus Eisenbacteria bacterium]MBI3539992.1 hemerythrin domain-containing protein [Candidatus Eisenbacteria bacterium]